MIKIMSSLFIVFMSYSINSFSAENLCLPVIDINFVILTDTYNKDNKEIEREMRNEVYILNKYFVGANGKQLIQFRTKGIHFYNEIKNSTCKFIEVGKTYLQYDSNYWQKLFNQCKDPVVVQQQVVNFYIYDSYSNSKGFGDKNGHGKNNGNHPYILFDWQRLNHYEQSPEEHEMGHALGLDHVCAPGASKSSDTNIMTSADCGLGSGGLRNIGFSDDQIEVILENARKINASE